jgi:pyruvate dehydrogenase E2 component (dihydrolipoamide acetyltransferase)
MSETIEVKVPDIGDYKDVPVIEVFVKPGDKVGTEDSLITVESDKATMEVPSPASGTVKELRVKVGDKVSQGSLVLVLEPGDAKGKAQQPASQADRGATPQPIAPQPSAPVAAPARAQPPSASAPQPQRAPEQAAPSGPPQARAVDEEGFGKAHASPSVRRLAREFGVDLSKVKGSGPKDRILKENVQAYVKAELARPRGAEGGTGIGLNLPPPPQVDFAKFGPVKTQPLSRIKKLSGAFLHRNWLTIPHVTQHDEADITELEAFRKSQSDEAKAQGIRFTILGFLMKASVVALKHFPEFNASLTPDGDSLVLKQYYHIGVAVDTPNGLVVPVIRDVDKKGLLELARELGEVSERMRGG